VLALLAGGAAGISGEPRAVATASAGERYAATTPVTGDGAAAEAASAKTLVLGHVDVGGRLDLLVTVAVAPGRQTGEVLLIPTAMLAEVPSLGTQALADVVRMGSLGGPDLLHTTIENMLGAAFDAVLIEDDAGLIRLLAPVDTMTVGFRHAVRVDDDAGTLAFTSGRQEIDAGTAMRLLVATGARGELDHLVTVQAVMEGWLAAIDAGGGPAVIAAEPAARPLVVASRAGIRYDTLPVTSVASGGEESFTISRTEARSLLERTMQWTLIGEEPRPRAEILNGTGEVGITRPVAEVVVHAGFEVTLTGNLPGFGAATTQVVYYRDADADLAGDLVRSIGVGSVARAPRPVDVVDVTIVVGADLSAARNHD